MDKISSRNTDQAKLRSRQDIPSHAASPQKKEIPSIDDIRPGNHKYKILEKAKEILEKEKIDAISNLRLTSTQEQQRKYSNQINTARTVIHTIEAVLNTDHQSEEENNIAAKRWEIYQNGYHPEYTNKIA